MGGNAVLSVFKSHFNSINAIQDAKSRPHKKRKTLVPHI